MIYPQLQELLALRHQAQSLKFSAARRTQTPLSGLYASVFRGQGMDFDEVREYQRGDEVRNIDWRVTARMRKPFLKVYREERERNVVLCVDNNPYMRIGTRNTFKSVQAARVAALLGWSAQGHGDRLSGFIFGSGNPLFFRPHRTQHSFSRFLQSLAAVPTLPTATTPLEQALAMLQRSTHTGSLLFIVTDCHHSALNTIQYALDTLRQHHEVVLINIDDPADYDLPAMGLINFLDAQGQKVQINTDQAQGRIAYRHLWENDRRQLVDLTQRLRIDFFSVSTQADVFQSLVTSLRQRWQQQRAHR